MKKKAQELQVRSITTDMPLEEAMAIYTEQVKSLYSADHDDPDSD
jgi:hypothetical protein